MLDADLRSFLIFGLEKDIKKQKHVVSTVDKEMVVCMILGLLYIERLVVLDLVVIMLPASLRKRSVKRISCGTVLMIGIFCMIVFTTRFADIHK
jgi:hypothetical protein